MPYYRQLAPGLRLDVCDFFYRVSFFFGLIFCFSQIWWMQRPASVRVQTTNTESTTSHKKTLLPIFCRQKSHFSCYIQSNQCRLTLLNARLNNLAWCFPSILQVIQDIQIDWSSPSIPYQSQLHFCMHAWPHHRCCRKRFFPPSERFERFVESQ